MKNSVSASPPNKWRYLEENPRSGRVRATHQIDEVVALAVGEEAAVEERPARSDKPRLPVRRGDRKTTGRRSQAAQRKEEKKRRLTWAARRAG